MTSPANSYGRAPWKYQSNIPPKAKGEASLTAGFEGTSNGEFRSPALDRRKTFSPEHTLEPGRESCSIVGRFFLHPTDSQSIGYEPFGHSDPSEGAAWLRDGL